ncbi:MAG: hypothetical protein K2X27_09135 [Candidatus Obscuribacterales bacterium]|nr:hypothetical protein [Candidatus Obscuribacterales bacterium]
MFVYLLISAELAILYTVFWYLYLREPSKNRRIGGNTWGSYHPAATNNGANPFALSQGMACAQCYIQGAEHSHDMSAVKPFMLPVHDEMVLDQKTSHYVPLAPRRKTALAAIIQQLDDCFSEFNVKA